MTDVVIFPVLVQGESAAADIAGMIDYVDQHFDDIDTLIVGRGGGSADDLWAFNEEIVARSIYRCSIPVISAVVPQSGEHSQDSLVGLRVILANGGVDGLEGREDGDDGLLVGAGRHRAADEHFHAVPHE